MNYKRNMKFLWMLVLTVANTAQGLTIFGPNCVTPPMKCPNNNITFWLYTRENQNKPVELKVAEPESIKSAPWVMDKPIKVLIHGYTGHKDFSPNTEIRPAYLDCNYNVISVDYNKIALEPCYLQAASNTELVGMCTAQLIDEMVNNHGFRLQKFHVIGFSLGGQTAGFIANYLKAGRLTRITALDPAMPMFATNDRKKKIDSGDADFVDVLHTNALAKGKLETCGHSDFFANGGMDQPGCKDTENEILKTQDQNLVKNGPEKKPQSVRDLFQTGSCIPGPFRCPHPKMQYYLYTRTTQEKGELINTLDNDSLTRSKFNTKHPTKVVVHGFGGGRNLSPSTDMRNAYFERGNYNIIIVDYGSLVKEPCLSQIEWAPRFAAMCITQLVEYLQYHPKKAVPPEKIHTIGYSVGAHILGLVANHLEEGKLGRITGLDPTIFFYMGNNRSRDLDYTDALFVDILHTGAGILGQWGPNGHADFYVNGGSSQPGCAHDTIFQTLSCDHTKVTPYFIESITSRVGFWAGPCPNLFSYLIGWCEPKDTEYVLMGEHVTHKARGVYYVTTNANAPYARGFPGKSRKLRSVSRYS